MNKSPASQGPPSLTWEQPKGTVHFAWVSSRSWSYLACSLQQEEMTQHNGLSVGWPRESFGQGRQFSCLIDDTQIGSNWGSRRQPFLESVFERSPFEERKKALGHFARWFRCSLGKPEAAPSRTRARTHEVLSSGAIWRTPPQAEDLGAVGAVGAGVRLKRRPKH